jgi:hypothetical protein
VLPFLVQYLKAMLDRQPSVNQSPLAAATKPELASKSVVAGMMTSSVDSNRIIFQLNE